jgi:sugar phosphate isomerase/epimerase
MDSEPTLAGIHLGQEQSFSAMKIGITYLYTILTYGYPPRIEDDFKALADIEQMGFHYLEMEALGEKHALSLWDRRTEFKKRLDDHGVHVHNFCAIDPDLVSIDSTLRRAAYERFKQTAELGAYLGTETLHLASYAPPVTYTGKRPYSLGEKYEFGDTYRIIIPDGFSWDRVWSAVVESCRATAQIAQESGLTVIMEPRVGEVICSVDSMLRLIHDVGMPNFMANFDTGHFCAQRENIPLALAKLRGKYANIHVADNDPVSTDHLPIGEGIIDWDEFFRVLRLQDYHGYLGLDLGGRPTLRDDLRRSRDELCETAARQGITLEY